MSFEVKRKSKWTVEAWANGEKCASAPSIPKLQKKLDEQLKPKVVDEEAAKAVLDEKFGAEETPTEETPPPKKTAKPKKAKRKTIKSIVLDAITEGKEDEEIIELVKAEFPDSKVNKAHCSWYRSTLTRDGVLDDIYAPKQSKRYKKAVKVIQ